MTEPGSYLTISGPSEGYYKEKGSKFLAFAFPSESEESVKTHLQELRKKYHDARHHCYAYVLGADHSKYRANDDGEPGHSAGDPILGQIRSRNLTNTLVVVVRYFGGTKLGVSGLINAYKTAAAEALDQAAVIRFEITRKVVIQYSYELTSEVMRIVGNERIVQQDFSDKCKIELAVKPKDLHNLTSKLDVLTHQNSTIGFTVEND